MLAFIVLSSLGMDMIGAGAIPLVILTLPRSLLALAFTMSASTPSALAVVHSLTSPSGTFLLFPFGCGAVNTVLIVKLLGLMSRVRR